MRIEKLLSRWRCEAGGYGGGRSKKNETPPNAPGGERRPPAHHSHRNRSADSPHFAATAGKVAAYPVQREEEEDHQTFITPEGQGPVTIAPASPTITVGNAEITSEFTKRYGGSPNPVVPTATRLNYMETSSAMVGSVQFEVGNRFAAFSNDAGSTWNLIDPFSQFDSSGTGGFCCDQDALYEPHHDLMFWSMMYGHIFTGLNNNIVRLAVYRKASAGLSSNNWIYYDLMPSQTGGPPGGGEAYDFPRMSLSNNYLYITAEVVWTTPYTFARSVVMRIPLNELAAGNPLTLDYYSASNNFIYCAVQGARGTAYFAGHNSTSSMRIFKWPETATQPTYVDTTVPKWSNASPPVCPSADGTDWCQGGVYDNRIMTGVLAPKLGEIWFFWDVAQNGGFLQPYINAARFSTTDFSYRGSPMLYHRSFPFRYVAAAANITATLVSPRIPAAVPVASRLRSRVSSTSTPARRRRGPA
jgi:hypothetical protein